MNKRHPEILMNQNGAVLPIFAISIIALLGFSAFAIDFGFAYMRQSQLQNVADSGALACAQNYSSCSTGGDQYPLTNTHGFTIATTTPVTCPNTATQNQCVQVIASSQWETFLLPLFGINNLNLSKTAIAGSRISGEAMIIRNRITMKGNFYMTVNGGSVAAGNGIDTTNQSGIKTTSPNATITVYNNSLNSCGDCTPTVTSSGAPLPSVPPYVPPASPTVRTAPACVSNVGTFLPGTYTAKVSMACASNTLTAGTYYFNGGFDNKGKTLSGTGVHIVVGIDKDFQLSGTVNLNSSSGGSTCGTAGGGMLIYQPISSTNTNYQMTVSGGAQNKMNLTGIVQLPNTDMRYDGDKNSLNVVGTLYLRSLDLRGNMNATLSPDPCQNLNIGSGKVILVQ